MKKTLDKLQRGEHVTIVALGDSNTQVTFHCQGRLNWVGLLAEAVFESHGQHACTMINAGRCGSTFDDALGRLDRDALRFEPDLVILALGINDAGQGIGGLDAFCTKVKQTIERIRDHDGCEVLLRTPNPVVSVHGLALAQPVAPGSAVENAQRPVKAYAHALVEVAEALDCPVVDHYSLWTQQSFKATIPVANPNGLWPRMSDAIHPGALGHLMFYRELAPYFNLPTTFSWEVSQTNESLKLMGKGCTRGS